MCLPSMQAVIVQSWPASSYTRSAATAASRISGRMPAIRTPALRNSISAPPL